MLVLTCDNKPCRNQVYAWSYDSKTKQIPPTDLWRKHLCKRCEQQIEVAENRHATWLSRESTKLQKEYRRRIAEDIKPKEITP